MIPPILIAALVAAAIGFIGGWHFGGLGPEKSLAELRQELADAKTQATEAARKIETTWAARVAEADHDHAQRAAALADSLDAARADGERMRSTIAAYAKRPATGAAPAACPPDDRASTLGDLLAEADRLAEESSRAADTEGERLRTLQAWVAATM